MNCPECDKPTTVHGAREQAGIGMKRLHTCYNCGGRWISLTPPGGETECLGPVPEYTEAEKVETGDRYNRLVKVLKSAPLTPAQRVQAQAAMERVRLRLNINRVPVGLKDIRQNGEKWGAKRAEGSV